jgi:xanthine dehydrogenase accessory factor
MRSADVPSKKYWRTGKNNRVAQYSNIDTWEFIAEKHAAGIPVILLYVLQSEGSSPGRQGFSMAVAGDDEFCGTIGGGIMEHKFVEMARSFLKKNNAGQELYRQVHNKSSGKDQSGMICSGEQTIFLYPVKQEDIPHIHSLIDSVKKLKNGRLELSNAGILFSDNIPVQEFSFEQKEDEFCFTEKTGFKNILYIIGGGHCALALSRLMSEMDFCIHVFDERDSLNTLQQNKYAHRQTIVNSYSDIAPLIESGNNCYTVIMTVGYRTDDLALRALLEKQFRYLGVLGSKKKMEKMFSAYREENINEDLLKNIRTPIGIQIKSRTTAEIAVSIAAEIISVKNA